MKNYILQVCRFKLIVNISIKITNYLKSIDHFLMAAFDCLYIINFLLIIDMKDDL